VRLLQLVDSRDLVDKTIIGENREKPARPIQVHAGAGHRISPSCSDDLSKGPVIVSTSSTLAEFVTASLRSCLTSWGIEEQADAELELGGEISRLFVTEENRYRGEAFVHFYLRTRDGAVLWQGSVEGSGGTYGHSLTGENYSMAVSDALKTAFAVLLKTKSFQDAWSAGPATRTALTVAEVKAAILRMMGEGIAANVIAGYVRGQRLAAPLTVDEILDWKKSGIAEEIVEAALPEPKQ